MCKTYISKGNLIFDDANLKWALQILVISVKKGRFGKFLLLKVRLIKLEKLTGNSSDKQN